MRRPDAIWPSYIHPHIDGLALAYERGLTHHHRTCVSNVEREREGARRSDDDIATHTGRGRELVQQEQFRVTLSVGGGIVQ